MWSELIWNSAINIYLDGSWKSYKSSLSSLFTSSHSLPSRPSPVKKRSVSHTFPRQNGILNKRYIGAFGVTGWATRSGLGLLSYGETVRIERTKPSTGNKVGKSGKVIGSKRQDVVVRFTNTRGEEVGRLENETAGWISTLLDQQVCSMDGTCVFAPDRLRTNDTIYLQIRCYILKTGLDTSDFTRMDSNRPVGRFGAQESTEERELRNRQKAIVKLLTEVNLKPVTYDEELEQRKREAILQAAELAEQKLAEEKPAGKSNGKDQTNNDAESSPSDEPEEGEELEQDQLDALYRKAQTFDFNTPEAEPPDTFALTLRKYQKQALHWMLQKETDDADRAREQSMHPLWDHYVWPAKDVDDKDVPVIEGQESLYVNPYAGELSLEFPVQDQNCLGGILADGKSGQSISIYGHANY